MHWYTRRVKEAIQIRLHPNNINRDNGIDIPEEWLPTIRRHAPPSAANGDAARSAPAPSTPVYSGSRHAPSLTSAVHPPDAPASSDAGSKPAGRNNSGVNSFGGNASDWPAAAVPANHSAASALLSRAVNTRSRYKTRAQQRSVHTA